MPKFAGDSNMWHGNMIVIIKRMLKFRGVKWVAYLYKGWLQDILTNETYGHVPVRGLNGYQYPIDWQQDLGGLFSLIFD